MKPAAPDEAIAGDEAARTRAAPAARRSRLERAATDLERGGSPLDERRRGRGAVSNPTGRFEPLIRALEDDGWGADDEQPSIATQVLAERAKTIITRNDSPDISFDRSINPYRGCEHGCIYCFARPSHAFVGLSPGLDFETKLFFKPEAARLLERELAAPNYQAKTIAMGTNTDPYQPIERDKKVTRSVLEVLARTRHPVGIVTKSALVLRDVDILAPMAADGLAKVAISLTTLDPVLARRMEPRAASPARRLKTIEALARAGIPVTVLTAPIVPGLNDAELETILTRRQGGRGARCRLRHAPPAAGTARDVRRMAARPLPEQVPARLLAHPRHARRQDLRCDLGPAHDGLRPLRVDDRAPLRGGGGEARLREAADAAAHGPLRAAGAERRAASLVLGSFDDGPGRYRPVK